MRPNTLGKCLESLYAMKTPINVDVLIIVVDNDKNASAKLIVEKYQKKMKIPLHYFVETNKGIPFGRNRAMDEANKLGATELAFIDDDEVVDKDWLISLFDYYIKHIPCTVTGPVISVYPENTPQWILKGKFFDRQRFATGTLRHFTGSGNLLFNLRLINKNSLRFNEKICKEFGEDEMFTRQMVMKGIPIYWVDEAEIYEEVEAKRLNLKYLIKRNYKIPKSGIRFYRELYGIKGLSKGGVYFFMGVISFPINLFSKHKRNQSILYFARSAGWLTGLFVK